MSESVGAIQFDVFIRLDVKDLFKYLAYHQKNKIPVFKKEFTHQEQIF